ncbi:hypothetical protein BYT27DRAFT_6845104 [Phlegmacium glaucopus]|nr:hypothetical protein BYT27DRAFT_6845104 [Phlegmacium glaucopus]
MCDTSPDLTLHMRTLKIADSQDLHEHDEKRELIPSTVAVQNPSAIRLAKLPPLPEGSTQSNRYYFFGWQLRSKWLEDLAQANGFPKAFTEHTDFDGMRYICWKSGYRYAYPVMGLVENGEKFEGQFPGRGKDIVIDVVMVFVNKKAYAHRRPTELQLAKLTKIFGSEPRWFKDGQRAKDFDDYEMWTPTF